MSSPSTNELKGVIVDILSNARNDGLLSQLTVRIVRQELATHFDIDEDVLNSGEYKSFIKTTVHATVNSLQSASDEGTELPRHEVVGKKKEKEKMDNATKAGARKPRAKSRVHPSDEEAPEATHESGCDAPSTKKATARPKTSKPTKSSKIAKKPESDVKFKSKAVIESSEDEGALEPGAPKPTRSPKENVGSAKSSPPKQKQQQKVKEPDSDVEMHSVEDPGPSSSSSKPMGDIELAKTSILKGKELAGDPMESELSSVTDEPPKKRQKKQGRDSAKPESTKSRKDEKARRGKKEVLSKDEETINKLKGIVVACGIRKVWKKEFEGLDKTSQQIKRLHSILGDLGMTPRYSLEKARAIREQRELAQELKDVQEFEKATKRRGKGAPDLSGTDKSVDQGGSDVDVPTRKKQNARASIMAFLQDQSEEE